MEEKVERQRFGTTHTQTHTPRTQWRPMTDDSKYNFIEKPNEKRFFN